MKLFAKLEKSKDVWFLLITSVAFFLLRLPSLFEPYWYGDEGIYQTIGFAMRHGSLLYRDIWDNKPPLLYVLYAIFNGDQFTIRVVSLLFGIGSIITFFYFLKMLHPTSAEKKDEKNIYITTGVFGFLFAVPLFEGNIANAENFMLFFALLAGLCLFRYLQTKNTKALWYAGILLAIDTLFKIVGIFDFAAFSIFLFLVEYKNIRRFVSQILSLIPFGIAYLLPIAVTLIYFSLFGTLKTFLQAAFSQNVGYVGYGNYFLIPQGLLYLKIVLLCCFVGVLFYKRTVISPKTLFIVLWLGFSLFNAFFSQRPYTHYILVMLPSLCLFIYLTLSSFSIPQKRTETKALPLRYYYVICLTIVLFLIWRSFGIYQKNISYYQNFLGFLSGTVSVEKYQSFFDGSVPKDYAIAQFLRTYTKPYDTVFLWGNTAQIYRMSNTLPPGRYTVAYHITGAPNGLIETAKALSLKKPRFIIIMYSQNYPFDLSTYRFVYAVQNYHIYESTL